MLSFCPGCSYHILASRGSGEYALSHLLEPFAFPRHALEDRLHELKVQKSYYLSVVSVVRLLIRQ